MRWLVLVVALSAGCPDHEDGPDAAVPPDAAVAAASWSFVLDAGAFAPAAWPSVVVYAPPGFHVQKPLPVVIWLHGLGNCASNVLRDQNGECTPDAGVRDAFQLAAHLADSARNALLIVPELSFDSTSDDAGNLATPNGLRALLAETLGDLAPSLGPLTVDDLAPVIVAAHSAGGHATLAILQEGGVPVREVWLLDALFDGVPGFVDWIRIDLHDFVGVPPERRFADVYTALTAANSINLAEAAELDWLPDAGAVLDERADADVPDDQLSVGLVFVESTLEHSDVARVWFERLLDTSSLPPR